MHWRSKTKIDVSRREKKDSVLGDSVCCVLEFSSLCGLSLRFHYYFAQLLSTSSNFLFSSVFLFLFPSISDLSSATVSLATTERRCAPARFTSLCPSGTGASAGCPNFPLALSALMSSRVFSFRSCLPSSTSSTGRRTSSARTCRIWTKTSSEAGKEHTGALYSAARFHYCHFSLLPLHATVASS